MLPRMSHVEFDAAAAYPEIAAMRAALARRDWTACRVLLDAAAPALRTRLITDSADRDGIEDFLRYVLSGDPDDSAAAALLGYHLIRVGWKIRSGYRAQYVSDEQFRQFHEWLRRAEQVLIEAAARNPRDPAVWAARLVSARGLQLGLAEVRRRYDRLAAIDPHHLPGQLQLQQSLCPKWSGTWEQMFAFSRECMLAAPAGGAGAMILAEAHIERWLDHDQEQSDRYFRDPGVRAELLTAAERSVLHPGFAARPYGWLGAANAFAFVFGEMGDRPRAAAMFAILGPFAEESPWHYLAGDPADIVRNRRAIATLGVPR